MDRFGEWVFQNFETAGDPPDLVCKRCRMKVGYPTKHAVLRHHDPIRILPVGGSRLGHIPTANAW